MSGLTRGEVWDWISIAPGFGLDHFLGEWHKFARFDHGFSGEV